CCRFPSSVLCFCEPGWPTSWRSPARSSSPPLSTASTTSPPSIPDSSSWPCRRSSSWRRPAWPGSQRLFSPADAWTEPGRACWLWEREEPADRRLEHVPPFPWAGHGPHAWSGDEPVGPWIDRPSIERQSHVAGQILPEVGREILVFSRRDRDRDVLWNL